MRLFSSGFVAGCLLLCPGLAFAHNHLTVDTATATPMNKIVIRAGYYGNESGYSIAGNRLMFNGDIAVYDVPDRLMQSDAYHGWAAGDEFVLTSDYFFSTGRLNGGDFRYEIVQVTPISGGPGTFALGDFNTAGVFVPQGISTASTRAGRSIDVGIGSHDHSQGYALTGGWVQDVTLIAWDANGVYADSDPVTIRFDTGDCPADFDRMNGVNVSDIFAFLRAWFGKDAKADFDGSGTVNVGDIFAFLRGWFAGCSQN